MKSITPHWSKKSWFNSVLPQWLERPAKNGVSFIREYQEFSSAIKQLSDSYAAMDTSEPIHASFSVTNHLGRRYRYFVTIDGELHGTVDGKVSENGYQNYLRRIGGDLTGRYGHRANTSDLLTAVRSFFGRYPDLSVYVPGTTSATGSDGRVDAGSSGSNTEGNVQLPVRNGGEYERPGRSVGGEEGTRELYSLQNLATEHPEVTDGLNFRDPTGEHVARLFAPDNLNDPPKMVYRSSYNEIIPEIIAKNETQPTAFTTEFVRILTEEYRK